MLEDVHHPNHWPALTKHTIATFDIFGGVAGVDLPRKLRIVVHLSTPERHSNKIATCLVSQVLLPIIIASHLLHRSALLVVFIVAAFLSLYYPEVPSTWAIRFNTADRYLFYVSLFARWSPARPTSKAEMVVAYPARRPLRSLSTEVRTSTGARTKSVA